MSTSPSSDAAEAVFAAIEARHCKRAFLDRPVDRTLLERALSAARHAPSSRNMQPWQVAVLNGPHRDALSERLCASFDSGVKGDADFRNNPEEMSPTFAARARAAGAGVLQAKGIARDDDAARRQHLRDNLLFYGAPVEMILHLPHDAVPGSFLAIGCFLQNLMLGLVAQGLGSCPQYSVAGYGDLIRDHLGLGEDRLIVCGLAVGYPDPAAAVNLFAPARAPLADTVTWHL